MLCTTAIDTSNTLCAYFVDYAFVMVVIRTNLATTRPRLLLLRAQTDSVCWLDARWCRLSVRRPQRADHPQRRRRGRRRRRRAADFHVSLVRRALRRLPLPQRGPIPPVLLPVVPTVDPPLGAARSSNTRIGLSVAIRVQHTENQSPRALKRLSCCSNNNNSTIRYDTRCYFNVRSKANMSQLNQPHGK